MKMTKEHYNVLKDCMIATRNHPKIIEMEVHGNLSDVAFAWRWYYKTPIEGIRPEAWAFKNLYPYLNDNHIQTALLKILRES